MLSFAGQGDGMRLQLHLPLALCAVAAAGSGLAQDRLEQAAPERVEENRPLPPVVAEPDAPPPTERAPDRTDAPETARVILSSITLTGLGQLSASRFDPALAPFLNRPLAMGELKDVVNAVVSVLHQDGYVFASARVPAQAVTDGLLIIQVDEGFVDGVVIEGFDQAFTRQMLEKLADGQPVTQRRLERQLLLAGDGAGLYVGRSNYAVMDGRGILTVKVRHDPVIGRVSLDNWGSQFIGPVLARGSVRFGGVFDGADGLAVAASFVPAHPGQYGYGRVRYVRRFGLNGTEVSGGVAIGESRPGGSLRARDTAGSSRSASIGLSHPIIRSRQASLWGDLGLTVRSSSQDQRGRPVRDDRFTNLTADLFGSIALGDARLRGRVTATQGLGLLGSTRAGDPLASRSDGSARFTTVAATATVSLPVAPRLVFQLAGEGQLASRPLLSSEEFGVGGSDIGRGYDYSERLGDQGAAGLAQLDYTLSKPVPFLDELVLSAFVDGGFARDLGRRRFDGSLASTGVAIGADLPKGFAARLSVGVPLTGPRDASGDQSPRIGFTLAKRL